jgi:hypothetical protein
MGDGKTRTPMSQKEWLAFEDGVNWERARVKANIADRIGDLNACSKRDNCNELARLIESYIPEWLEEKTND